MERPTWLQSVGLASCAFGILLLAQTLGASPSSSVSRTLFTYSDAPGGGIAINAGTACGSPIVRSFVVSDAFTVRNVLLGFNADHAWRGDIQATLRHPDGTGVVVIAANGGDSNANYDLELDDDSGNAINDGGADATAAPLYDRTAAPSNALSAFDGKPSAGTWQLEVCDTFTGADDGTYNSARLTLDDTISFPPVGGPVLHSAPVCGDGSPPRALVWGSPAGFGEFDWTPDGSLTFTATDVQGTGHNFTFTVSGNTGVLASFGGAPTPNVASGGLTETLDIAEFVVDPGHAGDSLVVTIDISPAVQGQLAYDAFHINGTTAGGDQMRFFADLVGGGTSFPTIVGNGTPSWQIAGPGFVQATSSSVAGTNDQVGLNFSAGANISRLTLVSQDCTNLPCAAGIHGWGLGSIQFCPVTASADLEITKAGPASVNAGDTIIYSVQTTNLGTADATTVVVTDTLPSTGTFVSASNGGTESGGVVTWPTVGTVTAADTLTYTVTFVAPATGSLTNVAAGTTAATDSDGSNNASSVVTSVTEQADVEVVKTGPASVSANDTVTYSVQVTNLGPSDAAAVVITDTLPSTGTFVSASNGGSESGGVVTWPTIGTMTPADTVTYSVTFVAPATGSLTNTAAATTTTADPTSGNNTSSVATSVTEQADVEVVKTGPASINAGDTITYSVRVTNLGPSDAAAVVITDTLPSTGTFVSASNSGSESGGVVTWPTIGTMTPADTVTYTVSFVAPATGSLTNTAAATTTTADPTSGNNTSSVATSVTEQADVEVVKTGPASVNAGDTITYSVQVTNLGPSDAAAVVITDTLPSTGTFVSASNSGSESGGVVTWPTIATMTTADTVTYTVVFVAPATGSLTNIAAATTATVDPTSGNNTSSVVTSITEQADVEVVKTGPASVNAGDTITYSVRVTNLGPSDAAAVAITDTLPSTGTFVSASNGGSESGGVVTWPTVGTMTPADTVTYTVTFVAPATGSLTNIAAATTTTVDPTSGNNSSSVATSVTEQADLSVTKTGPPGALAGDTILYVITTTNLGPSTAASVVTTDTLPAGATFVDATGGGSHAGGVVTWSLGSVASGVSIVDSVRVAVPTNATYVNVAAGTTTTADPDPTNNNGSSIAARVTTVVPPAAADLVVTKTGPTTINAGDTISYGVKVVNLGPDNALAVVVTDTLPATGTFVSATAGGSVSGGVVTWPTVVTLLANDSVQYTVTYVAPPTGTLVNIAAATSPTADTVPGSERSSVTTTVVEQADLSVNKTGPATANAGDTIEYVITATNLGPSDAASVVVSDTFPTELTYVSSTRGGTLGTLKVTWPAISIPAGTSVVDTVTFTTTIAGSHRNIGFIQSTGTNDPNVLNDDGEHTVVVTGQADLEVVKTGPASVDAADTITYSVRVTNLGPSAATAVVITDTLPSSGSFVSASNGGVEAAGVVTWPTLGSMTTADTVTYTVTFVAPASGSLTNTAAVSSGVADPVTANNTSGVATTVSEQTDLEVVKTGTASANAGDTIMYSVRVTTLGPSDAASVVITDTLPPTGTFVSASNSGVESGGVVTWPTIGSMTTADTVTYTVTVVAPGTGTLVNVAAATTTTTDINATNDRSSVSTVISERADLDVLKTGPASANAGDTISYTVRVTNLGVSDASAVVITDTLPGTGTFVSASNGGSESGGVVTWPTIGSMTTADTVSYTVTFVAPVTGTLTNTAAATSATTDPTLANNTNSVATVVSELADVEVLKTGPAAANAGDTITYSVRVTNLGPSDAGSVVITDTLPSTGTFVAASNGGTEASGVVTWPTIGSMTTADTVTYTVTFVASASGGLTNTAAATTTTTDPTPSNNTSTVATTVAAQADLEIVKTGPASVVAADTVTYTLRATNLGVSDASTVVIADTLPTTGTFVSATNGGVESGGVITWPSIPTMTTADTVTYTVTFVAPSSGSLQNTATITSATPDPVTSNNSSVVNTTVLERADLEVAKTGPAAVNAADTITYTVQVTNLGPSDAASVIITDTLPSSGTFVTASDGASESGGVVTWPTIGSMTPADTVAYTITFVAPTTGTLTNRAAASTTTTDPNSANNLSSVATTVAEMADVEVTKTGPAAVNAADTITYSIQVTNLGASAAASVVITDTLPPTGTFVSASNGGVEASGVVTWPTIGSMTTADTVTYSVTFVAPASGTLNNTAAATSSTADPDSNNNRSAVATTVAAVADLEVVKTGPATVNAGDTITYSVRLTNLGPSAAASVVVTDTLPGSGTFVSATNGGTESGGVVAWPTIGTVTPTDTITYTVTFVAPATGSITNIAAAATPTTESGMANNRSAVSTTVTEVADLQVTKTGPVGANLGDTISYVITTTNLGPSGAAAVVVTDTLPGAAVFVDATGGGVEAAGVVTWSVGSLASGATAVDTVRVSLPSNATYVNVAAATSTTTDPDPTNNNGSSPTSRVTTNVPPAAADLAVLKTGPASINAADTVVYTISVTNAGPDPAQNVVVTDTLPASGTFVSASGGGTEASGVVTWPLVANMTTSDTLTYTVRWMAPTSGALVNVAAVASPTADTVPANNTSTANTTVSALTDVAATITAPATANAGDTITYTVLVTNNGPSDAASVVIADTLPSTGTFVSASNGGTESGGVVTWPTVGTVTLADTLTYTVTFVVPATGSITSTATVATATTESTQANNVDVATTVITEQADVVAIKTGPATATAGDTIAYTIEITSNGPSDAASVVVTDTLPATGTFVSATGGGIEASGVITWPTVTSVTPTDTVSFTVTYVAPSSGSITNIVATTSATADPDPTNNDGSGAGRVTTTISALTDVAVSITAPATANAGDTIVYTVQVTNNGPSDATAVVIADSLPATGTFVSASNGGTQAGGTVTWPTVGTVTPSDTLVYTVTYVVPATGSLTSTATVATSTTESTSANNVDAAVTTIVEQADVAVAKAGPASVNAGDTITYQVQVTNLGPSAAAAVVITDTLPVTGTFVSATNGGSEAGGVVTWPTLATMTTADTVTYSVTFVAPASGSLTNVATASSTTADPVAANNTSSVATSVTDLTDVAVSITGPATANAGDTIVHTVQVTNNGPSNAANVVVTDSLPGSGTFVSATGGGIESGGVVTWPTTASMTPADTLTYTVTFVVPASGAITSTAAVSTSTTESTSANNTDAVTTTLTAQADLEVVKSGPAAVNAGDTIVYWVRVTNLGPSDAAAVAITDTLPVIGTFASASHGGTQSGGVVTWPTVATMTPTDTVTYSVTLVAPTGGSLSNTAAATTTTADPNTSNNTSVVNTSVTVVTDLAVDITGPASADAGDTITYTIQVTNNGPSDASSVVIADSLPATGTFVSATGGGTEAGGTVTWPTIATFTPADTVTYMVTFVVPTSGTLTSTATAATPTNESTTVNNVDAVVTTVAGLADLEIVKTGPASALSRDTVTFTLRIVNLGPSTATNVVVTDTLPATDTLDISGAFVSASNGGTEASAVVTWPTIASMLPGDTIVYTVDYQLPNAGPIVNRAAVTSAVTDPNTANNNDQASVSVTPVADLQVNKTGPVGANAGDTITYVVTASNPGPNDAASVVITDTLPAGVLFVDATGGGTESGGVVTWSIGTLARTASRVDTVRVQVPANAIYTNIVAGTTTTLDSDPSNNDGSAASARVVTVVPPAAADLAITKTGPASVNAGDTISYGVKVVNRGPDASQTVVITDTLPSSGTYVSASNGATESGGVVTWPTLASLAANDSVLYTVQFVAPASGTLTNVAAVTAATADTVPGNETSSVVTSVTPRADLEVVKSGPAAVTAGDTIVYSVLVTNLGPSDATSVVITDTLPATGTFVAASAGGTETSGVVTWPTVPTMTPTDTVTYTVRFVAPAGGPITNAAAAASATSDPTPSNNTSTVVTSIGALPAADLEVTKTGPATALAGDTILYGVKVVNRGPDAATGVVVTDTLPGAGVFVAASGGGTEVGGVVTWPTIGSLAANDSVLYTVQFETPGAGVITNLAAATSTTADTVPGNETSSVTTTVTGMVADVEVVKAGPASVNVGDTVTYQIRTTNLGPNAATAVVVTDTLPATVTFVSASGGGSLVGSVITWPTVASMTTADTVTHSVVVVANSAGTITNISAASTTTPDADPTNNDGSGAGRVTTTVGSVPTQADIRVTKTGPSSASIGDTITYAIVVTNDGGATATSVQASDLLPTGLAFVSASGGGSIAGSTVTWPTVPTLAMGASLSYSVRAVATSAGSWVNIATATSGSTDPDVTNNDGSSPASRVTTVVATEADVRVSKTGPSSAAPGDTIEYRLVVTNDGPSPASAVSLVDSLPAGLTLVSASDGGSLVGGVVTWPAVPTLAAGASFTRSVRLVGTNVGVRTNVARVSSATLDSDPTNNRDEAVTTVMAAPDLAIEKSHVGAFTVGSNATYSITVTNLGAGPTTDPITVVDTLPVGLTFVDGTGSGWTFTQSGEVVTATRTQSLATNASTTLALTVAVGPQAAPSVLNRAHVATAGDPDPTNNTDDDTVDVGLVDLAIQKDATGPFNVGDLGAFSFTVTNVGTAPNSGAITVVDTLPAGLTYDAADGAGWSVSSVGGVVRAVFNGTLAPGASSTFAINVRIGPLAAGALTNTATVSTDGDPGDSDTAEFDVSTGSDLVIEKSSSQPEVEVGDVVDYALIVSAVGSSPIPDVSIIDELPPGFRYVPGTSRRDGQPIPDPTGGVGPELGWSIGVLPAGSSVTLTYRVEVGPEAMSGDGINRATALSPATGKRSNVALAAVRLRPGAFTDEGMIAGKVYVECGCEIDGQQAEELGVPGVRVLLQDGTSAITDSEGKFHFFGLSPRNWVVKVDPATLPAGAELTRLTNRHGSDGSTLLVDLKSGELARADFADASGAAHVIADVKARRATGEVGALMLDPTAPEQMAAQRAVRQGQGPRLFESLSTGGLGRVNTRNSNVPHTAGDMARLVDSTALTDTDARASTLQVTRPHGSYTADGVTTVPFRIATTDGSGSAAELVTLESTAGRWLIADADPTVPGLQVPLSERGVEVVLQAPDQGGSVVVRATRMNQRPATERVFFGSRVHDIIAAGLLEARLDLRTLKLSDMAVGATRNRFEDELSSLSVSSDEETWTAGARASLFAQGRLRDDINLTLRVDTEEDERSRLFRDIRPDEFYPVYGDASVQAFDAQSKGRFFGRLDRGASYLQYGDFNTSSGGYGQLGARELGRYSRTLNGVFQHSESERYAFNAFASRDRFMQVVDELRGEGISGPYQLSRAEGLVNSERVELVTRDRNQPAVILSVQSLERYTDYSIEPFSGRLIFKRPIPSVDAELNPVAIRVTYEVETGGDAFWVYGADAQVRAADRFEIGGGYVRDDNAMNPFDLASLNATLALSNNTLLMAEWARSDSADVRSGQARRMELRHGSARFDGRLFYLDSDASFENPSAAFGNGRTELGFKGYARINDRTALFGEGLRTEDQTTGGVRRGWSAGLERAFGDWLRGRLGYRWADETTAPATSSTAETTGATPNETHAVSARLTGRLFTSGSVFGEFEQDVSETSQRRLAVGGDYRLLGRARLYGRHEFITSLAGPYALNPAQERNTTVFGVAADILPGQSVFSEYRMRDAVAGREAQAAIGLRNQWSVAEGVRLSSSFERLSPLGGEGSTATAVTGGIEYTANPLWRASARAEYRAAESGDNVFGSLGYARKLNRDWTFLGNSVFSTVVDGDRAFARTRAGFAYRQTDANRWNALARYEHRYDRNPDLSEVTTLKTAHIFAGHVNYQPDLDVVLRGQWASKWASERSGGFDTNTQAHLAGLRTTVDVTDRFDVGAIGRVLLSGAFESAQWGLGAEVGMSVTEDLRLSAGYNVFGFADGDFGTVEQTDHGFYLQVGFTFDEGLFWGRDRGAAPSGATVQSSVPNYAPNATVLSVERRPIPRDTLLHSSMRITDEVITEDLLLIDMWMSRAAEAADTSTAQGRYAVARAIALAGIAKTEYTDNDRTPFPNELVREVKRTVLAMEASAEPVLPEPRLEGSTPVAPELWAQLRDAKDGDAFGCVAPEIARLEANLLWAGNEELTCSVGDPRPHLERAREMAAALQDAVAICRLPSAPPEPQAEPVEQPRALAVPNVVHFAFDESDLDGASTAVLDTIAALLADHPEVTIAVHGHTDVRGSNAYNQRLGGQRATRVLDYLAGRGVSRDRMRRLSRGETETLRDAVDEHDHARNRRVEVLFFGGDGVRIRTHRQERDLKPRGLPVGRSWTRRETGGAETPLYRGVPVLESPVQLSSLDSSARMRFTKAAEKGSAPAESATSM